MKIHNSSNLSAKVVFLCEIHKFFQRKVQKNANKASEICIIEEKIVPLQAILEQNRNLKQI